MTIDLKSALFGAGMTIFVELAISLFVVWMISRWPRDDAE